MRKRSKGVVHTLPFEKEAAPITHCIVDKVWVFYTPQNRIVQSETYEEAYAKWLLTKETD